MKLASWCKRKLYKSEESDTNNFRTVLSIEKQADAGTYAFKEIDGTYFDYLEILVQQGYVILFSTSFALGPILAFINNIAEFKVDKWKITRFKRRPEPKQAKDIGVWFLIFNIITYVGIFSSWGIVCVTKQAFSKDT